MVLCEKNIYAYARRFGGETVYMAINNSRKDEEIEIPVYEGEEKFISLLSEKEYTPAVIYGNDAFYNGDVNEYVSKIRLILPGVSV